MNLEGKPSDQLPEVLATGKAAAQFLFISFSGREPSGRDAEYIEWHSLDHRPEQYRLHELRHSLRLVSTPECRGARAASTGIYDQVDHVMNYMFTGSEGLPGFLELGQALDRGGRMPLRLPSYGHSTADLAGMLAAPHAVAGADVIPWRPALGVYLVIERGHASPESLIDVPGVAGLWWYHGRRIPGHFEGDNEGLQMTYCYLDRDPVLVAKDMAALLKGRWGTGVAEGLLAAPFYPVSPYEWDKHLPVR